MPIIMMCFMQGKNEEAIRKYSKVGDTSTAITRLSCRQGSLSFPYQCMRMASNKADHAVTAGNALLGPRYIYWRGVQCECGASHSPWQRFCPLYSQQVRILGHVHAKVSLAAMYPVQGIRSLFLRNLLLLLNCYCMQSIWAGV